jgi:hypothetical protein
MQCWLFCFKSDLTLWANIWTDVQSVYKLATGMKVVTILPVGVLCSQKCDSDTESGMLNVEFSTDVRKLSVPKYVYPQNCLTYLLTYLLTPRCRILFEKLIVTNLSKKSCFLYGKRRFITVLTKARHWTLSWASRIYFTSSIPVSLRSLLMLSSHLHLGLPSSFSPASYVPHVPPTSSSLI